MKIFRIVMIVIIGLVIVGGAVYYYLDTEDSPVAAPQPVQNRNPKDERARALKVP